MVRRFLQRYKWHTHEASGLATTRPDHGSWDAISSLQNVFEGIQGHLLGLRGQQNIGAASTVAGDPDLPDTHHALAILRPVSDCFGIPSSREGRSSKMETLVASLCGSRFAGAVCKYKNRNRDFSSLPAARPGGAPGLDFQTWDTANPKVDLSS